MWSYAVMRFNRQLGRTDVKRAKELQLKKASWERRAERLMAPSFFTEEDQPGAVGGAADSYERGQEKEGREGGCALSWVLVPKMISSTSLLEKYCAQKAQLLNRTRLRPQLPAAPLTAPAGSLT